MEYNAASATVQEFIALFGSNIGHFYRSDPQKNGNGEKVEAIYYPILGDPDEDAFISHLEGKRGLSILLNKLGPDGRKDHVTRACVDIDDYGSDPQEIAGKLRKHSIPVVLTISKSGGIHVHLLFKNLTPAKRSRRLAQQVGAMLGHDKMDYFPKQDEIDYDADTGEGNKGNGLNLCYFGDSRIGWSPEGPLDLDGFVSLCYESQLEEDEIEALMASLPEPKGRAAQRPDATETAKTASLNAQGLPFYDGPPCLQKLAAMAAAGSPVDNSRNNFLYNVAVFCKISGYAEDPDDLADAVTISNIKHLQTPMSNKEVATIAKSVAKSKTANYKCREDPICGLCDRGLCDKRRFGAARRGANLWFEVGVEIVQPDDIDDQHDPDKVKIYIRVPNPASTSGFTTFLFRKDPPTYAQMKTALAVHGLPYMDNHDAAQWNTEIQAGLRSAQREYVNRLSTSTVIIGEAIDIYITQGASFVDRAAELIESDDTVVWKNRAGLYLINPAGIDRYMRTIRPCTPWMIAAEREEALEHLGVKLASYNTYTKGKNKARRLYQVDLELLRKKTRMWADPVALDIEQPGSKDTESDDISQIFEDSPVAEEPELPQEGFDDDPFV